MLKFIKTFCFNSFNETKSVRLFIDEWYRVWLYIAFIIYVASHMMQFAYHENKKVWDQ